MKKIILLTSVLVASLACLAQKEIEIIHLDIGQGDATLIISHQEDGSMITVLFDAGGYDKLSGEDAGAIIHNVLTEKNIDKVDYLVISHYDADHIGGIVNGGYNGLYDTSFIIGVDDEMNTGDDITVVNVIDRGDDDPPTSTIYNRYIDFTKTTSRKSIEDRFDLGYTIKLGGLARFECIAANGNVLGRDSRVRYVNTENEKSLSFYLSFKDFDYLISGDLIGRKAGQENAQIETEVGSYLLRESAKIDVLHVNHHGADNCSESTFLEKIKPEIAIISCGDNNSHGHPNLGALERLVDANIQHVFQTNEGNTYGAVPSYITSSQKVFDGHIVLKTDGESYNVSKYGYSFSSGYYYEFNCDQ